MNEPIDDRKKSDRGQRGRFAPGNKASPGRPPGRGPVAEMRALLATDLDKIVDTLKSQALAGDAQAIRIILDRVLPALRPVELPTTLALPEGTLTEQGRAVLAAIAAGDLAPGQGATVLAALGTLATLAEADELDRRVAALEARSDSASKPIGNAGEAQP